MSKAGAGMDTLKIVQKGINELKEYERNPRKNDKAVAAVAESIKEFGFKIPIIIDKDGIIVAGHTRLKAAKRLKFKTVPCIIADDLTPEQIKAFRLADNKVGEIATWDTEMLSFELGELDFDMGLFGFDDTDWLGGDSLEPVEDEVPEVDEENEPICKLGDIWQLGRHRLMCGDSTDTLNYKCLTQDRKVDLVFTDPPYGMKKEADGVLNDNLNYDKLLEFNKQWIPLTFDALKENGSWYCWGIDEPLMDIYSEILKPMMRRNEITFRNLITWDKGYGQGQLSSDFRMFPIADEKCLFVMKGVQGFNTNADNYYEGWESIRKYLNEEMEKCGGKKSWRKALNNQMGSHYFTNSQWLFPTEENYRKLQAFGKEYGAFGKEYGAFGKEYEQIKKEYEQIKKEYEQIKKEYYANRAYFNNTHDNMNNVWHFNRTSGEEREQTGGHATPKPIALCSRAIKSSSRENEIVLDVFGGSGSTLIACEQLNRTCYMMELDPKYCDVIIKRWENFTGAKAELVESATE